METDDVTATWRFWVKLLIGLGGRMEHKPGKFAMNERHWILRASDGRALRSLMIFPSGRAFSGTWDFLTETKPPEPPAQGSLF